MSQLVVSSSPHLRDNVTTTTIMRDVIIGLAPAAIMSVVFFGIDALILMIVCVASSVLFEFAYQKLTKQTSTINDLSAVVTGLLLAFCLPASLPPWMAVIGSFTSIVVIKQLFGGLGCNFANPALVGRIVLMLSFPAAMAAPYPRASQWIVDATACSTPLGIVGVDVTASATLEAVWDGSYTPLLLGHLSGTIGEVCKWALLLGGLYLVLRKVITITIPLSFLGSMAVFSLLFGQDPLFHLLTGGAILGAFFMATDYVTSPITEKGKLIFGILCGFITMVIRTFGNYPEGVSFAILLMNILAPQIDNLTLFKPLGGAKVDE